MSNISELARKQTRRTDLLNLLAEFEKSDPAFLAEIGVVLGSSVPRTKGRSKPPASSSTAEFDKIKGVLEARKNAWTDTSVLIADSQLTKAKVAYVLNKTHPGRFDKQDHPDHGKKKQWRLKVA